MATYTEDLSGKGPLKRAAIDAYMWSEGWSTLGDTYMKSDPEAWYSFTVTKPDANGEGGGTFTRNSGGSEDDQGDDFKDAFDQVRGRIDDALDRWKYLPDPTEINTLVESMRAANKTLAISAGVIDGTAQGGGTTMASALVGMHQNASAMSGKTIGTFKLHFLNKLATCVGGLHAITTVLGATLSAEEGLWRESRQSVADAIEEYTKAFEAAAAPNGGNDWDLVFKVVGWAVAGGSIFATGGATTALGILSLGLDILEGSVGEGIEPKSPGGDYESVMSSLESALTELNDGIEEEERQLEESLEKNHEVIYTDKDSFDLSRPNVLDIEDADKADIVVISRPLVNEITNQYLPAVGGEAKTAQGHVEDSLNLPAFSRDSSVGVGAYGPMWTWLYIQYTLKDLLADVGWECNAAGKTLKLAIDDLEQADRDSQRALDAQRKRVAAGSGVDPWDLPPD